MDATTKKQTELDWDKEKSTPQQYLPHILLKEYKLQYEANNNGLKEGSCYGVWHFSANFWKIIGRKMATVGTAKAATGFIVPVKKLTHSETIPDSWLLLEQ